MPALHKYLTVRHNILETQMKKIFILILTLELFSIQVYSKDKLPLALIPFSNETELAYNYSIMPKVILLRCIDCEEYQRNLDIAMETYFTLTYMEYRASVLAGTYRVKYENIFNQSIEKIITVDESNYRIKICLDSLAEYQSDLWNELTDNDTIKLVHIFKSHNYLKSTGLVIFKFKENFIAEIHDLSPPDILYESILDEFSHWSIDSRIIRRVILTKSQIKDFSRFEDELKAISNGGTWTIIDYYSYTRNQINIIRNDSKNKWLEFEFIRKKIFGG
jgi:hypothetical protein